MIFIRTLAAGAFALAAALGLRPAEAAGWDETYFPNFSLVTHEGETVRFYDDLVRDRIVVINFVYTECPDICSLSTARLAEVADWLGERVGRDILLLSITLDPVNDTPEKLAEFARAFGLRDGWLFLTGVPEELDLLGYKLGERSKSLNEHRSDLVIGNGATGEWRRGSAMGSLATLAREILEMDPNWRPTRAGEARAAGYAIADRRGEALFLQGCASCHTVGGGVRVGPDLVGVTLRRDHDWLVRFIRAPDAMRAGADPVALTLDEAFPGVRMPNLGLGESDVEDLIHYLRAEADRVEAESMAQAATGHDHGAHGGAGHGSGAHDHSHHAH